MNTTTKPAVDFERWCRENGHGELDDMLMPLDRSLLALMWSVWQGAVTAERERAAKAADDYLMRTIGCTYGAGDAVRGRWD